MKKAILLWLIIFMNGISIPASYSASARVLNVMVHQFYFQGDKNYSWLSEGVTDTLISDMAYINGINVYRNDVRTGTLSGKENVPDDAALIQAGELMSARIILTGNIEVSSNEIRLNASIIDAKKKKTEKQAEFECEPGDIFRLQERLALWYLAEIEKLQITDVKPFAPDDTTKQKITNKYRPAYDAYTWYCRGLEVEEKNPLTAYEYYLKAMEISPDYTDALECAGSIAKSIMSKYEDAMNFYKRA